MISFFFYGMTLLTLYLFFWFVMAYVQGLPKTPPTIGHTSLYEQLRHCCPLRLQKYQLDEFLAGRLYISFLWRRQRNRNLLRRWAGGGGKGKRRWPTHSFYRISLLAIPPPMWLRNMLQYRFGYTYHAPFPPPPSGMLSVNQFYRLHTVLLLSILRRQPYIRW